MLPHNHPHLASSHNAMGFSENLFSRPFYGSELMNDVGVVAEGGGGGGGGGGGYGDMDMLRGDYTERLGDMGPLKSFSNHSMLSHMRRNHSVDDTENLLDGRSEEDVLEGRYNPHSLMRNHHNGLQPMQNSSTLLTPMSHLRGMTHQPQQPHHHLLDDNYDGRLGHSLNQPSCTSVTPSSRFMSPHLHNNPSPWKQPHLIGSNHNPPSTISNLHSPNNNNNNNNNTNNNTNNNNNNTNSNNSNMPSPLRSQNIIHSSKLDDHYSASPTSSNSLETNTNTISTATSLTRNTTTNTNNSNNNGNNSNNNVPFYPWMSVVG